MWDNPVVGEDLLCECEVGNHHDTHAVAVKIIIDDNLTVIGHNPKEYLQFALYSWDVVVPLNVQLMNLVNILQIFLKGDLKYPVFLPSLHKVS